MLIRVTCPDCLRGSYVDKDLDEEGCFEDECQCGCSYSVSYHLEPEVDSIVANVHSRAHEEKLAEQFNQVYEDCTNHMGNVFEWR